MNLSDDEKAQIVKQQIEAIAEDMRNVTGIQDRQLGPKIGNRFNNGKLRWRNFPKFLIRPLVEVGQKGEEKYGTYNFLKGLFVLDTLDCLNRHLDKAEDPNLPDIDEESGCHHLAHVAWNALVALYMIENRPELDDRFKGFNDEKTDL